MFRTVNLVNRMFVVVNYDFCKGKEVQDILTWISYV